MARRSINWDDKELAQRIEKMPNEVDRVLSGVVRYHAPKFQRRARIDASWTDRTGNARNGLFAKAVIEKQHSYAIVLHHTMPYGFWLEVRFAGRYAVILPTLDASGPEVMRDVARLFVVLSGST